MLVSCDFIEFGACSKVCDAFVFEFPLFLVRVPRFLMLVVGVGVMRSHGVWCGFQGL